MAEVEGSEGGEEGEMGREVAEEVIVGEGERVERLETSKAVREVAGEGKGVKR